MEVLIIATYRFKIAEVLNLENSDAASILIFCTCVTNIVVNKIKHTFLKRKPSFLSLYVIKDALTKFLFTFFARHGVVSTGMTCIVYQYCAKSIIENNFNLASLQSTEGVNMFLI